MFKKNNFIITILIILLISLSVTVQSAGNVTWKLALLRWIGNGYKSLPVSKSVNMKNNDSFQIYLKTQSDCYCYIIKEDSSGNLSVVLNTLIKSGTELYLPEKEEEFHIAGPSGTDKYSIIVSSSQQKKLEYLISAFTNKNSDKSGDMDNIRDEILSIKQECSNAGEAPEKPVAMGGVTRGAEKILTQYGGSGVYVKTIRIQH